MKRNFLFMSMLAALFMAGCSQEEITPGGEDNGNGEANTSYMAVNLMSSDVTGTRAAAGYEDGSEAENDVEKVRFYFFTANGAVANVKLLNGSYVNFYDWEPTDADQTFPDGNGNDDIGSKLKATIVISTKDGDKLPQRIAAVLNPPRDDDGNVLLGNTSMSLTNLKAVAANYAATGLTTKGKFVMFNSVYGENSAEVCAVPIKSNHLQKTEALAKANPVTIYVERSVAKVSVALGSAVSAAGSDKLALKDKNGNDLKVPVGGEQVYLKLNGWSLTAETDEGRLVKAIDPAWTSSWWNGTHRSFWAINSEDAANDYNTYNNTINNAFSTSLYTNENALDYASSSINRTKVILKGTLCKADGTTPFTIIRHLGIYSADTYSTTESSNLPVLKASILNQLTAGGYTYYSGDNTTRTGLSASDLKIVIVGQATSEPSDGKARNCYVYAQLTDVAKAKKWYTSSNTAVTATVSSDVINGKLADKDIVDRALVWKSGMTYYYYEIIHHKEANQTNETATKGVVRNHIYKTTVTKIAGLGTPVYDPDQVIYPEKPDDNDHYIAAEIDILSWRIVENNYELKW